MFAVLLVGLEGGCAPEELDDDLLSDAVFELLLAGLEEFCTTEELVVVD